MKLHMNFHDDFSRRKFHYNLRKGGKSLVLLSVGVFFEMMDIKKGGKYLISEQTSRKYRIYILKNPEK